MEQQSRKQYKAEIIRRLLYDEKKKDVYGRSGLAKLLFAPEKKGEGEEELLKAAKWFLLPQPQGRRHEGEPDFVAQKLIRALYLAEDRLKQETLEAIHDFFTKWNFESEYKSENHMLIFHSSRYLYALRYPEAYFTQYEKSGEEICRQERDFLQEFIRFRAKEGWAEFDSLGYGAVCFECLLNLIDFGEQDVSAYARMSADLQLMDMIADCSRNGFYGGAHGRVYERMVFTYEKAPMCGIYQYYFGDRIHSYNSIEMITSLYEPSAYVYEMLAARPERWENREAKHLHSITCPTPHQKLPQVPGSIDKYTYVTPEYVLGAVNHQDAYPEGPAAWYAHHQQHEWDLSLCESPDLRIFTHHPGNCTGPTGKEHGYWTGDMYCCCGQFYCRKNTAMAVYRIPEGELHKIHVHIPLRKLEVIIEGSYLWFTEKNSGVYGMLWSSSGFCPGSEAYRDEELFCEGDRIGIVCLVGTGKEYGSQEAFRKAAKAMPITYDPEAGRLEYGDLAMEGSQRRYRGEEETFPYPAYDNPMMHGDWGAGVITLYGREIGTEVAMKTEGATKKAVTETAVTETVAKTEVSEATEFGREKTTEKRTILDFTEWGKVIRIETEKGRV